MRTCMVSVLTRAFALVAGGACWAACGTSVSMSTGGPAPSPDQVTGAQDSGNTRSADSRTTSEDQAQTALRTGDVVPLWGPDAPPNANASTAGLVEEVVADNGTPEEPLRTLDHIGIPSLSAYVPERPNGAAAIILCGGGYTGLVIDKEGTDIAHWLNTLGVTALVLKFRLPGEGWDRGEDVPLQDGQRAMRLVRQHATEWRIDPTRIGVVGFSSGGHTASMVGTFYAEQVYPPRDEADSLSARPDFLVLAYGPHSCNSQSGNVTDPCTPGTLGYQSLPLSPEAKQALYDKYATDLKVDANTPPAFILMAHNDEKVDPENALRFYRALKRAEVSTTTRPPLPRIPAELHVFSAGGHGFAIRAAKGFPIAIWTTLAQNWMAFSGILPAELCSQCVQ